MLYGFRMKKITFMLGVVLFLFLLWCYTSAGLTEYVYINSGIKWISLLIADFLLLIIIAQNHLRWQQYEEKMVILYLLIIVIVLYNNQNLLHGSSNFELFFISSILLLFVFTCLKEWYKPFFVMVKMGGLFYSIMTVLTFFSREFYINCVYPIFVKSDGYNLLLKCYENGFMPGFTNHYSSNAMFICVPLGFVLCNAFFNTSILKNEKKKELLIAFVMAVALLLTGKRAHIIFTIAALFLTYYIYQSNRPRGRLIKIIGVGIIVFLIFFIVAQLLPQVTNFIIRFQETSKGGDVTLGRIILSVEALSFFAENPLLGIGWDGFKYQYFLAHGIILNVHNVYVQLLCETGLIGSTVFYVFFIVNFHHCVRAFKEIRKNRVYEKERKSQQYIAMACFMQTLFLLYCTTGNPLYDTPMLFPYICACAIGMHFYREVF